MYGHTARNNGLCVTMALYARDANKGFRLGRGLRLTTSMETLATGTLITYNYFVSHVIEKRPQKSRDGAVDAHKTVFTSSWRGDMENSSVYLCPSFVLSDFPAFQFAPLQKR